MFHPFARRFAEASAKPSAEPSARPSAEPSAIPPRPRTPLAGQITWHGIDSVGWVFQSPLGVPRRTALDHVMLPLDDYGSVTAASVAVGAQLGVARESLRRSVAQAAVDDGARPGVTTAEVQEIRRLKVENMRLTDADAILRVASTLFAGELDSRNR